MADVDEIIDYIKSLKKGFDKELFESKIQELSYAVDTEGLNYEDFHTLFKVWLNLTLPITKWVSLGSCLVPQDQVEKRTVDYALRWILANYSQQSSFVRIGFLLDWLTASMECDCVDMVTLDNGYEIFYTMLSFESLTVHAMKLVYSLTKPMDVTRRRVVDLLDCARKREAKKNLYRQLQVLLGLFKSYKPECVPEEIPAISIHTAFKKLNENLLTRFKGNQERRNQITKDREHLIWINPINCERGRNKKAEPLVPNMEFVNMGSKQYDKEPQKNYLDFSDPVSLVQHSLHHSMSRPARLRALLANETGLALLATASRQEQAFFSHHLSQLLDMSFFSVSPHSGREKRALLRRLARLQRALAQAVPPVTRFLARLLPFWNERDFAPEILELAEWVDAGSPQLAAGVARALGRASLRAQPAAQCAALRSLTYMYTNLLYQSTKQRYHFLETPPPREKYDAALREVATVISDVCKKGLQVNPEDMRLLYTSVWSAERRGAAELRARARPAPPPAPLALGLPLLSASAALVDKVAGLMILYRKIKQASKNSDQQTDEVCSKQFLTLRSYTCDMLNCLYTEEALSSRKSGLIFERMHPQLVAKLGSLMPDVDSKLSLRNHIAFAAYTYIELQAIDYRDADNKLWFNAVIEQEFPSLSKFLKTAVPELRYQ